jgi:hypothetical protein
VPPGRASVTVPLSSLACPVLPVEAWFPGPSRLRLRVSGMSLSLVSRSWWHWHPGPWAAGPRLTQAAGRSDCRESESLALRATGAVARLVPRAGAAASALGLTCLASGFVLGHGFGYRYPAGPPRRPGARSRSRGASASESPWHGSTQADSGPGRRRPRGGRDPAGGGRRLTHWHRRGRNPRRLPDTG